MEEEMSERQEEIERKGDTWQQIQEDFEIANKTVEDKIQILFGQKIKGENENLQDKNK